MHGNGTVTTPPPSNNNYNGSNNSKKKIKKKKRTKRKGGDGQLRGKWQGVHFGTQNEKSSQYFVVRRALTVIENNPISLSQRSEQSSPSSVPSTGTADMAYRARVRVSNEYA